MSESRTKKVARNAKYSLLVQALIYLVTFIGRSIFIHCLDQEYLGVGGLFSNILSVLALAELGVSVAMTYFLYKPLSERDEKQIAAYMNFYALAYRVIGCFVLIAGAAVTPFLPYIIRDPGGIENIPLIYLLYVTSSGVSYFFAYKRTIIIADQNGYIDSVNHMLSVLVQNVLQCVVLLLWKNFILYLAVQIATVILFNIIISIQADKRYPFLRKLKKERLSKTQMKEMFRYIGAMMSHKVGSVVVNGTDNILITTFDGLVKTGLYSNYSLIITSLNKLISQLFSALAASVGNLNAVSEVEHKRIVFRRCTFLNGWMTCFCSVCLWCLFQPFVTLWAGSDYLLDWSVVFVVVLNFFVRTMNHPVQTFKVAGGYFWNDRFRPIAEAVINLVASVVLGRIMGLPGILWGTAISALATNFWVEPYVVFKHNLKESPLSYFTEYGMFTALTVVLSYFTNRIVMLIPYGTVFGFLAQCAICLIVPNVLLAVLFWKKAEFVYVKQLLLGKLKKGVPHER